MRISRVQRLIDDGFDESYAIPFQREWRVKCSQCEALCINGIPCHETGCPNEARVRREREAAEREDDLDDFNDFVEEERV